MAREKARVKRNERGGMCARLCASEGRKREEGWVVTPWKSGDSVSALNPPALRVRKEGQGRGRVRGDTGRKRRKQLGSVRLPGREYRGARGRAGCSAKFKEFMANSAYSGARRVEMKTEREDFSSRARFWR